MDVNLDALVFSFDGNYTENMIYQRMVDVCLREEEVP